MSNRNAMHRIRISFAAFAACLVMLHCGCASTFTRPNDKQAAPQPPTRDERKAAILKNVEQRRDQTQYQAALDRWSQGDAAGCEMLVSTLVARRPDFRDARRLLADLCLDRQDLPAAESHLRILLEQAPDDAQTHHSLGLLLEESDRRDESLFHLDRAIAIEPENELYSLSRDAARLPLQRGL